MVIGFRRKDLYMVIGFRRREGVHGYRVQEEGGVHGYRVQGLHYLHKSRVIYVNLTIRTVYRGFLISGCWNRGVHCIQRCPHFRVLE